MRLLQSTTILLGSLFLLSCQATSQSELEVAFPNLTFTRPLDLQSPKDGTDRIFVVEQRGIISVFPNLPSANAKTIFLDIRERVNDSGNEEGLLGLAFHPRYAENGFFYINYTAAGPRRSVISRFSVSATDPNVADPNSELVLLTVPQPYSNHNGGQVAFGPDGFLYISLGDGGAGGDPQGNGQNLKTLLGAILRIDVDHPASGKNYGIPADNPFAGSPQGERPEIFAYGLRNPWRFSFDAATGVIYAGDVGQNRFEEIDIIENGKNYGWNIMEGLHCFSPPSGCNQSGLTLPIWEYGRGDGISVTGGYVYRGKRFPDLAGAYVYGDFGSGRIWALRGGVQGSADSELLINSNLQIASFGVDNQNELYICDFSTGRIYRFKSVATSVREGSLLPQSPRLQQNYPNPFNPTTAIAYSLQKAARVSLLIFDINGRFIRELVQGFQPAGTYHTRWHGTDAAGNALASGTYFYQLRVDGSLAATRRMTLVQ